MERKNTIFFEAIVCYICDMEEKKTYRELEIGEIPCPKDTCEGILVVNPDNSYKLTCDHCGFILEDQ